MKKQIYSFFLVLVAALFSAAPVYAQEENEEAVDALEKAEAKKFRGLEYEVPELKAELKSMCDQYLSYLQKDESARASRQLVVLMDTIMKKPFRQRVDGLVAVGHYFVQNRSEKAAVLCKDKIVQMDKAPTMRHTIMFCAEVAELTEDYGSAITYYDDLLYLDDKDALVFERKAYVSKFRNEDYAVSDYKKLLTLSPDDYNAYKHLGDIYFNKAIHDNYKKRQDSLRAEAIEYYRLYFEAAPKTADAIEFRACQRYVSTMYERQAEERHKENDSLRTVLRNEARRIAQLSLDMKIAPTLKHERLMNAYVFFCDVDNKNYDLARQSRSYITTKLFPDSIYKFTDYAYAAKLEMNQAKAEKDKNKLLDAIPFFDLILEQFPDSVAVCKNVEDIYVELKRPLDAVPYRERMMVSHGDNRVPSEDKAYAELFASAIKLTKDSIMKDSLTRKLATVYDNSIKHYVQRLSLDSVKQNKMLSMLYLVGVKDLYQGARKPEEGLPYYAQYLELLGDSAQIGDKLQLARLYFAVIQTDTTKRALYTDKADKLYEEIALEMESGTIERLSEESYHVPWYERAQLWITNHQTWEEKPKMYYEKALEYLGDNPKMKDKIITALDYLMLYHYFISSDYEKSGEYAASILLWDSSHQNANVIIGEVYK